MKHDLKYLQLLAKSYPNKQAASTEIINLEAILNLPKGTEHYITDLHGESEAFENVLRNGSGVIKQKVLEAFGATLSKREMKELCTLIYYPEEKLELMFKSRKSRSSREEWYKAMLLRIVKVLAICSSKYTRSKVRKALPKEYSYIIEELLHEWIADDLNKQNYVSAIVDTIISTGRADHFITEICFVIQRLVIDSLHIIGDIYDRGPGAHLILDKLTGYHNYDIQWGNHDIVWMGAAAGSKSCVANVLRICFRYANMATLEDGYGINILPLATFAMEVYKDDPCTLFLPKKNAYETLDSTQSELIAKMHKAIAIIQFKMESRNIARHPEFHMEDRNLLHLVDYKKGTIKLNGREYELLDKNFPTIDPGNPYKLTEQEQKIIDQLTESFITSPRLAKHIECFLSHGSLYLVRNSNLMFHGSMPLNEDGSFKEMEIQGKMYKGKALFDKVDSLVRAAYYAPEGSAMKQWGQDFIWYLWCGPMAPTFDKSKMATYERYFLAEKETHKEVNGHYLTLKNDPAVCDRILNEFGINDTTYAHIINGHIPVKTIKGEDPVKAGGKLLVIDGGYSKAYQPETGIAGYTLISNSQCLKLVKHKPFESREVAVKHGIDVESETTVLQYPVHRIFVRDTDNGKLLQARIQDLKCLLEAYRAGEIPQK